MKKIFIVISIFISLSSFAQTDVNVNTNLTFNGESNLVRNPLNGNLTAEWMKLIFSPTTISMATSMSTDNGATWSTPNLLPHHYGNVSTSADPTMAYHNSNGKLYAAYIDSRNTHDSGAVYVVSSMNSGTTWSTPVKAVDANGYADFPVDRPWIAVDNSGTASDGTVYLVTKSYKNGAMPHKVWFSKSTDGGLTWSQIARIDTPAQTGLISNSMGIPAVGADGKFYIAYLSYDLSQSINARAMLATSSNQGQTFSYSVIYNAVAGSGISASDTLYQPSYSLSANPLDANNLIFIFTDNRNGDPDIYETHCVSGLNFTPEIRLNDDTLSNGKGQDMCWGNFSNTGIYSCCWRDRRNGTNGQNSTFQIFTTNSPDDGVFWSPNMQLSSGTSNVVPYAEGNDFIGVAVSDSEVHCTWANQTGNIPQIFTNTAGFVSAVTVLPNENGIKIYPNPTSDFIFIEQPNENKKLKVVITSVDGKELVQQYFTNTKTEIDLKSFSAGVYFVNVFDEKNRKVGLCRVVKN